MPNFHGSIASSSSLGLGVGIATAIAMLVAGQARAQSAQPYSVQVAALATTLSPGGSRLNGFGIEPQLRFNRVYSTENRGAISVGVGAQYSVHSGASERHQLLGVFVEPRWALPFSAGCAYPYLSARASALRVMADFDAVGSGASNGYAVGAGPGVTFRMTPSANLDVGVLFLRQDLGTIRSVPFGPTASYAARVGVTLGLPR